jgi:hypothetical protein
MYRTIDTGLWGEDWFQNLSGGGKFLYLYLRTNSRTAACGAYHVTMKTIVFEMDIEEERIRRGFAQLIEAEHVQWWPEISYVFLPHFFAEVPSKSVDYIIGAAKYAATLPDEVREAVYAKYPILENPPPSPKTKTKAPGTPSDTLSNTLSETVSREGLNGVSRRSKEGVHTQSTQLTEQIKNRTGKGKDTTRAQARESVPYSADFLRVYGTFPKHRDKKEAWEVWQRLAPDAALVATMEASIERMIAEDRQWRAGFVPSFPRWLRGQHWEDEPEPERPEAGGKIVHLRPAAPDPQAEAAGRRYAAFRRELATYGFPPEGPVGERFRAEFGVAYEQVLGEDDYDNVLRFVRGRLGIPESEAADG